MVSLASTKKGDNIERLNPFFHPSMRFFFLQHHQASGSIDEIANELFYSQNPIFREKNIGYKTRKIVSFTTFATNLDEDNKINFYDLSMVILNNRHLKSVLEGSVKFMVNFCNVIVYLRKEEDTPVCNDLYFLVRNKNTNKQEKDHTFFIELIETQSKHQTFKFDKYWRKRILFDPNQKNLSRYIQETILFQKNNFSLGKNKSSLFSFFQDPNKKKFYKEKILLDIFNNHIGPMIQNSTNLVNKLKSTTNSKDNKSQTSSFLLQSKFHKEELDINRERKKLILKTNKLDKDKFYSSQIHHLRNQQLNIIHKTAKESPVFKLIFNLNNMYIEDKMEYLVFLENLLIEEKISCVFKKEPNVELQVIHFIREIQHIYKIFLYFLQRQSQSQKRDIHVLIETLNILPGIFAQLFSKMYPMEIFNGEYLSVPTTFLKGMIDQLSLLTLKNPKIAIISVLGLQSSGKSTFLNNLFHLNFSTKDDKCTRGSNAVMLKVNISRSQRSQKLLSPDYIILVDTEGLGSPENLNLEIKGHTSHQTSLKDEKMIIFNLGISNLCVINSMKEFNKEMFAVIEKIFGSLILLHERNTVPELSFVFQGVANDKQKISEINETSTKVLKIIFDKKHKELEIDQEKAIKLSDLISTKNNTLFCVSKINSQNNYPKEYKQNIKVYLEHLFSNSLICQRKHMRSFDYLRVMIDKLGKILNNEDFYFDGNQIRERTRRVDR